MSLLLLGVSHRTAPFSVLDQIAAAPTGAAHLRRDVAVSEYVAEAMVVATCNRIEILADVTRFHGALSHITEELQKYSGIHADDLAEHVYVLYEEKAVEHLFALSAGLDSMIVGEQQVLGQVRQALREAQESGHAGRTLNDVGQRALRVGKRIHHETAIDRHGSSIVSVALSEARRHLGEAAPQRAVVIGAGAMSSLAVATLRDQGCQEIWVASRTLDSARRLAESHGVQAITLSAVDDYLTQADLVVTATGANGLMVTYDQVERAIQERAGSRRDPSFAVVDLALPHDTDPLCAQLPGVVRIDLSSLADAPDARPSQEAYEQARAIVEREVSDFLAESAAQRVEPVVVSLRAKADEVVQQEIDRLRLKLPHLSVDDLELVAAALRRTVSTLLHTPTVRVKQLAADPDGERYAEALHALFDLDNESIEAIWQARSGRS